jgi:hypothetical protein
VGALCHEWGMFSAVYVVEILIAVSAGEPQILSCWPGGYSCQWLMVQR